MTSFSIVGDKSMAGITDAVWCETMDLAAVMCGRSVSLHRLNWDMLWRRTHSSPVTALAWRPDGDTLAVADSAGSVVLYATEMAKIVARLRFAAPVSFLRWQTLPHSSISSRRPYAGWMDPSHQSSEAFVDGDAEEDEEADDETNRMDAHVEDDDDLSADSDSASSSPESLPFSRVDANPRTLLTSRRNDMRSTLTVLLVGLASGHTHLLIGGTLAFGAWSPLATPGDSGVTSGDVASALVDDVARRLVVVQCQRVHSVSIGALMHDRAGELREAWMRCTSVSGLLNSLSHAATEMSDAWEKSIVDFDARMSRFSAEIRELGRTVHQDMLQMLTCGQVSSELETFLVSDLNEAGLKRLGTALDASYTRLVGVGNNAIRIAQLLVLRLGELVAFARCKRRYALLGLNEQACQATVDLAAAFVLKCIDLLRILQRVRTGLREFLFWLRIWMHKLADEAVPASLKDHQINTDVIVEFLRSNVAWDDDHAAASTGTSTTRRSDTQRASAFFARQDMPPLRVTATEKTYSTSSSSSNSEPYKSYVVSERASLMQLLDQLIAAHSATLNEMHAAGSRALNNTTRNDDLISRALPPSSRRVHMIEASNSSSSDGGDGGGGCSLLLNVVRNGTSASITRIYPTGAPTPHETTIITCTPDTSERIRNAQLYDSDTVALLLGKNIAPTPSAPVASAQTDLALVPLDSAFEHSSSVWSDLSDRHRSFPKVRADTVALSGARQVGLVATKRRVHLVDLGADEDDDDDDEEEEEDDEE